MKKNTPAKLTLHRETLQMLDSKQLTGILGALSSPCGTNNCTGPNCQVW